MAKVTEIRSAVKASLPKAPTGIHGLDEITAGGFPRGRPTLVCGSAGCGKTLLAMEFIVRGATQYNFSAFDTNEVERKLLRSDQLVEVEAKRADVLA